MKTFLTIVRKYKTNPNYKYKSWRYSVMSACVYIDLMREENNKFFKRMHAILDDRAAKRTGS